MAPRFTQIDIGLVPCPFCTQPAVFGLDTRVKQYMLRHHPTGMCPARCDAFCANVAETGKPDHDGLAEGTAFAQKLWHVRIKGAR
jgi:hypothetical protein